MQTSTLLSPDPDFSFKGKEIGALSGVTFFASKTKVSLVFLFAPGTSSSHAVWARS